MKLPGFLIDSPELVPHAIAIRAIGKQTIDNVIEIGGRLTECKRIIKHGGFGDWLKREFGWTDRLARAFMQVFEMSKTENFSDLNLPVSSVYLLAAPSTPETVRKEVIARASKGEKVKGADIKRAVKAAAKANGAATPRTVNVRTEKVPLVTPEAVAVVSEVQQPITLQAAIAALIWESKHVTFFESLLPEDVVFSRGELDDVIRKLRRLNEFLATRRHKIRAANPKNRLKA